MKRIKVSHCSRTGQTFFTWNGLEACLVSLLVSTVVVFQIVIKWVKWVAHSVATPALLCHKEPAQGTQSPILEDFAWESWRSNMMNQPMQWEQSLDISLTRSLPRSSTTKCRNCSGPSPVPTTASTLCSIRWWGRNQSELQSFHTENTKVSHFSQDST